MNATAPLSREKGREDCPALLSMRQDVASDPEIRPRPWLWRSDMGGFNKPKALTELMDATVKA